MSEEVNKYGNDFLQAYMEMVEETESPRVYHLWSALAGVSACMGRRLYLPWGDGSLYPNLFVLLVGTPAGRKSTAMNTMQKILRRCTSVRFAQDDCAGKRQGVIAVMVGEEEDEIDPIDDELQRLASLNNITPETLGQIQLDVRSTAEKVQMNGHAPKIEGFHDADKHVIFAAASEFNTFIGHGNIEFLEFLGKMYDGEPYDYRLRDKKERKHMEAPLVSLIGCTTPTNIAEAFPSAAIGQGFASRIIFVHGGKRYKSIARPRSFDPLLREFVEKRYSEIYYGLGGEMSETPDATEYANFIYEQPLELTDGRFTYYIARRHTHFLKLGMVMAAARGSKEIGQRDYEDANALLVATEKTMPDALGEYGMSPMAAAKQQILEFIIHCQEPVSLDMLWAFMHRNLKMHELSNCLNDLVHANKIQQVRSDLLGKMVFIPLNKVTPEALTLMETKATVVGNETVQ